jgi:7-cyano-7-deazaguanine synthase in queuosine biosynthesis
MVRNYWSDLVKEWGQRAIDDAIIPLDTRARRDFFLPIFESLEAKENTKLQVYSEFEQYPIPRPILLPLSGGMDSLVAYEKALKITEDVRAFFVLLNTPYSKYEHKAVKKLQIPYELIDLSSWPARWKPYKTRWQHILPLRNLLIIMSIAERVGDRPGSIWLAATDGEIPPSRGDKSMRFFDATNRLLETLPIRHRLEFPLRHETKTDLVTWWIQQNLDVDRLLTTITCQQPVKGKPCGVCHACFNRWVALANNGLAEDTVLNPWEIDANAVKVKAFSDALESKDFSVWSERRIRQTLKAWHEAPRHTLPESTWKKLLKKTNG